MGPWEERDVPACKRFSLERGKRGLQRGEEGLLLSLQQQRGSRVLNRGGGTATLRAGCSVSLLEARLGPFPCQPLSPGRDEGGQRLQLRHCALFSRSLGHCRAARRLTLGSGRQRALPGW